jgi:hypothetical protein
MRAAVLAALAVFAVAATSCENCSCGGLPGSDVFLTDADSGATVPLGQSQSLAVELQGSGRTITLSNSAKLAVNPRLPQPDGLTLDTFSVRWAGTEANELRSFGGLEVLSAPPQDSHPAWQVTVVIATDPFTSSNVIAVGQSMVLRWHVGDVAPRTSDPSILAAYGVPYIVKAAVQTTPGADLSIRGPQMEQQLFYAAAPGRVTLTPAFGRPLATNERFDGRLLTVAKVDDWVCSVDSGCSQTTGLGSPAPDYFKP